MIADPELFDLLSAPPTFDVDSVVRKAIKVKAGIVSADEKESDVRRLLNYGHTIGHGLEAALGYSGLTHGEAVAWGMIAVVGLNFAFYRFLARKRGIAFAAGSVPLHLLYFGCCGISVVLALTLWQLRSWLPVVPGNGSDPANIPARFETGAKAGRGSRFDIDLPFRVRE